MPVFIHCESRCCLCDKPRSSVVPNDKQAAFFSISLGCVRKRYNLMLNDRIESYKRSQEIGETMKIPTPAQYKNDSPFLKEVDSLALANAQLHT
ncbi:helix-turn-helix domain-containing protein [Paenibacillus tengchongensis]|uniref:helix-turn-helix domain-containing protein n=1 Tax=Paenibacillus tengchongensis TaxID=2608684 RepID=UPI00124CDC54